MRLPRARARRARIEIIPMIDTIFFLLVFFMIATLSMAVYRGLPVGLPAAATGGEVPGEHLAVSVRWDGAIALDREPMDLPALLQRLPLLLRARSDLTVVVTADAEARHGRVIEVMDGLRRVGVRRLAIAVRPREE